MIYDFKLAIHAAVYASAIDPTSDLSAFLGYVFENEKFSCFLLSLTINNIIPTTIITIIAMIPIMSTIFLMSSKAGIFFQ